MKRFLKRRWHSIPVALLSALLVLALTAGGVFAAVITGTTQTITQEVVLAFDDYGSITADPITLDRVMVGENVSQSFPGAVIVEVGPDGVGKYLHLSLNTASDLYSWCGVTLTSHAGDNPITGMRLTINVTYGEIGGQPRDYGPCSVQLTEPGTYIFEQTVGAILEGTPGTAEVKVDITLEDDPAEENTEPY